jgi:hypothetical protein
MTRPPMARHYRCEGNETAVGLMNLTASTAAELSGPPPWGGHAHKRPPSFAFCTVNYLSVELLYGVYGGYGGLQPFVAFPTARVGTAPTTTSPQRTAGGSTPGGCPTPLPRTSPTTLSPPRPMPLSPRILWWAPDRSSATIVRIFEHVQWRWARDNR